MKATKYKANQASDEVRVENRNHGLRNKTKNSKDCLAISKAITKGGTTRSCPDSRYLEKSKLEVYHCLKKRS